MNGDRALMERAERERGRAAVRESGVSGDGVSMERSGRDRGRVAVRESGVSGVGASMARAGRESESGRSGERRGERERVSEFGGD